MDVPKVDNVASSNTRCFQTDKQGTMHRSILDREELVHSTRAAAGSRSAGNTGRDVGDRQLRRNRTEC